MSQKHILLLFVLSFCFTALDALSFLVLYQHATESVRSFSILMEIALPGGLCPDLLARLQPHVRLHSSARIPIRSMSYTSHQSYSILDDCHIGVPISVYTVLKREGIYAWNCACETSGNGVVTISLIWKHVVKDNCLVFNKTEIAWTARMEHNHSVPKCAWK